MPKERDLLKMIWTNFVNSLKPRTLRGTLVGRDKAGNEYFEIKKTSGQRGERYFQANVADKRLGGFDSPLPAEWEAWLRGRRPTPPTDEEIAKNTDQMVAARKGATEKGYVLDKRPEKMQSFPTYDDYEIEPGLKRPKPSSDPRK